MEKWPAVGEESELRSFVFKRDEPVHLNTASYGLAYQMQQLAER